MEAYVEALAEVIRSSHERLVALADELGAEGFARDEVEQLVHGFESLLLEALEGRGTETRTLFIETAVPAVLASGRRTQDDVISSIAAFAALLSADVVARLPEAHRKPAALWLAQFFREYAADVARAMRGPST